MPASPYAMTWEEAVQRMIEDPVRRSLVKDCYFDLPQIEAVQRFARSPEWASVISKLPSEPGRALDVGAGNGLVSYALAHSGWAVTAVEPDPSSLVGAESVRRLALAANLEIDVVEGFSQDISTEAGGYDAIVARQVFHHAPDINAFAADLARLLKPGGLLLTWRDHVISRPSDIEAFFDRHPLHREYGGENAFLLSQYQSALDQAGLVTLSRWRHFDDILNYDPQPLAAQLSARLEQTLPRWLSRPIGDLLGSSTLRPLTQGCLSALDRRPGRHIAFLARKPA